VTVRLERQILTDILGKTRKICDNRNHINMMATGDVSGAIEMPIAMPRPPTVAVRAVARQCCASIVFRVEVPLFAL
jgi:hypothetical protein